MAEVRYDSRRVWTYSRDSWDPPWWNKLGVPFFGGDEWGRRTIVVSLWFTGALVWAFRTCWCQECHEVREQTYRWRTEDADESAAAIRRMDTYSLECSQAHSAADQFHDGCDGLASGPGTRPCACPCHLAEGSIDG